MYRESQTINFPFEMFSIRSLKESCYFKMLHHQIYCLLRVHSQQSWVQTWLYCNSRVKLSLCRPQRAQMTVRDRLQSQGKGPRVLTEWETGWAAENIRRLWRRDKYLPLAENRTTLYNAYNIPDRTQNYIQSFNSYLSINTTLIFCTIFNHLKYKIIFSTQTLLTFQFSFSPSQRLHHKIQHRTLLQFLEKLVVILPT